MSRTDTAVRVVSASDRAIRPPRQTDAGVALMGHADQVFEHLAGAEAEIDAIARLEGGSPRIATVSSAGAAFVVDAVADLRLAQSCLSITLIEDWPSASSDTAHPRSRPDLFRSRPGGVITDEGAWRSGSPRTAGQ